MKIKASIFAGLMLLFLGTFASHAIVLFQDNFSSYPAGPLNQNAPVWLTPPGDPAYATNIGISATGSGSVSISLNQSSVQSWALFTNGIPGYSITLPTVGPGGAVTNFTGTFYYFPSNAPVAALYASFTVNVSSAFANSASGDYFSMFINTNFNLHPRVYICTNGAASGFYRLGINNNSAPSTLTAAEIVQQDLSYGTTYQVVFKQVLSTGLSTLWINPVNETTSTGSISPAASSSAVLLGGPVIETDTSGTNVPSFTALCGFGFHTGTLYGTGAITVNNLICGTAFEDVLPSSDGSNPPYIAVGPVNTTNFVGQPATLSVVAGGDYDTMTYQWKLNGTNISGATSSAFTIGSLASGNAGSYTVGITNNAGGILSGAANLQVLTTPVSVSITTPPANTSVTVAGTATFTVTATDGGAPMTYQWYYGSTALALQTNSTLTLASVTFGEAGNYSVKVSNFYGATASTPGTLTVNNPSSVTIAYLHNLLDTNYNVNNTTTLFTVTGTVTTWHDMTSSGSSEFYMQDATGGTCVYWSGAASSTNLPPAGAKVQVVGPLSDFDGLIELSPVFGNPFHSVTIISTNNPLPTALPVPFDPNITNNPNIMVKHLQGLYMVASNVFLDTSDSPTFTSVNSLMTNGSSLIYSEPLYSTNNPGTVTNTFTFTNQVGQTFTIYYNGYCDYIGQTKPTGPVTVYGVMGQFGTSPFTNGYEFTPSRLADIVGPLLFTNVISNVIRHGDAVTNSYSANVLQPGETLTTTVVVTDPGGGNVTLTAGSTTPSGGGGGWTINSSGGKTATATYTFTAHTANMGINYTNSLQVTLASGTYPYTWTVYVPTADEQLVRISEVFPYATSSTNSPAYNPLQRPYGAASSIANDEYVEIASYAPDPINLFDWSIGNGSIMTHQYQNGGPPYGNEQLTYGTCAIVYGGPPNNDTNAPTLSTSSLAFPPEPANGGNGMSLGAGSGVVTLYDANGYLVDRVVYPATGSTVQAYSRFPGINGTLVPQSWVSTNYVTPGNQYNGASWATPAMPIPISPVKVTYGNPVTLNFLAKSGFVYTLFEANAATNYFIPVAGGPASSTNGSFSITNAPTSSQFYSITTSPNPSGFTSSVR